MQVEVNVENCWCDPTLPPTANLELSQLDSANSIATTTWETWLATWLSGLQSELPPASNYELSLRLTTDPEIQALNALYRHRDQPTDVLAFAALEVECPQSQEMRSLLPLYLGDIVISVDTAQRQAQQQGHNLLTELAWLTAHGLLHLLGWDHPDEESLMSMLAQQAILLQKIGLNIDLEGSWQE